MPIDYTAVFGDDFESILFALDQQYSDEIEAMFLGIVDRMVYDVNIFTTSLEKSVQTMMSNGVSVNVIQDTLQSDLRGGGAIFGKLRNDIKASVVEATNQSSRMAQYEEYFKKYDEQSAFAWIVVSGHKLCPDCADRGGYSARSFVEWEALGLPAAGATICGGYCYCVLDPVGKMDKKVKVGPEKKLLNPLSRKMAGKHLSLSAAKAWAEKHVTKSCRFDKNNIKLADMNKINKFLYETIEKYDIPLLDEIGWQMEVYKKTKNIAFLYRTTGIDSVHKMGFNKAAMDRWQDTFDTYKNVYTKTGRKWAVDHLSLDSVIKHEVGHHLYYSIKDLTFDWNTYLQHLRARVGNKKYFEISKEVSEYAASNPSELFAEVHSAVMMGFEDSLPPEILSIYNKVLGN